MPPAGGVPGPEAGAGAGVPVAPVRDVPGASDSGAAIPLGGDVPAVGFSPPAIGGREYCDVVSGWRTGAVGATRTITSQTAISTYGAR